MYFDTPCFDIMWAQVSKYRKSTC